MSIDTFINNLLGRTWRDKLQDAYFRGVPFYVSRSETGVGRRNVVHQYPFRTEPYVEDLGKDTREFVINGYVIANKGNKYDYIINRDKLMAALEKSGGGLLKHPYHGDITVSLVGKARVVESNEEGGIARFTMTFVPTGINRYPVNELDNVKAMDDQALKAENALQDSFGSKYLGNQLIGSSLTTIANDVRKLYSVQRKLMAAIQGGPRSLISTGLGYVDSSYAATFDSAMANGCGVAGTILSSYNSFKNVGGIVGGFKDNILTGLCSGSITKRKSGVNRSTTSQEGMIDKELGRSMIINFLEILIFDNNTTKTTVNSQTTAKEALSREHLRNFIVNAGLTAITQVAVRIDYQSQNDALNILNQVNDGIDGQLDRLGDNVDSADYSAYGLTIEDDESFEAMKDLRKVFTKSLQNIATNLPGLIDYSTPYVTTPALVLAYNQYKDLNRESEIISRNQLNVPHPGFLPAGETIQILSY